MKSIRKRLVATEDYLGSVREHLSARGASPERVGQHLEEMASHLKASGANPVDEFGPSDILARRLTCAEQSDPRPRARLAALILGLTGWSLAFFLLLGGSSPAVLSGVELGAAAFATLIGVVGLSTLGAQARDQIFGVSQLDADESMVRVGRIVAVLLGALGLSVVTELAVGDRSLGVASMRSWVAGLVVALALSPATWWAYHRNLGRPRFPAGSPLRASSLSRQVSVQADDQHGQDTAMATIYRYAPVAVALAMIFSTRWLSQPYDLFALLAGPALLVWFRRTRAAKSDSACIQR